MRAIFAGSISCMDPGFIQGVCFAGLDPARPLPQVAEDKYVAFVSGLGVGDEGGDPLRLALIVDYLTAQLGSAAEQSSIASKVLPAL